MPGLCDSGAVGSVLLARLAGLALVLGRRLALLFVAGGFVLGFGVVAVGRSDEAQGSESVAALAAATSGEGTALHPNAVVLRVAPPASGRIPAGVREVLITRARHGRAPSLSIVVTSREKVSTIISMIDRLAAVKPGVFACPAIPVNPPVVTLRFRAKPGGPVLAQATQAVDPTAGAPCQPMILSIRGRAQLSLAGGVPFLRSLGRLIGVTLAPTLDSAAVATTAITAAELLYGGRPSARGAALVRNPPRRWARAFSYE